MLAVQNGADGDKTLEATFETARLAALNSYQVLDPLVVEVLSRLSGEAAASLRATQASVSFVDATRVWLGGASGLNRIHSAREHSYCDTVVRSASPLLVPDGLADPRFRQHELVHGEPGLRCYAGAPLIDHDGYVLGAVAVYSVLPAAFSTSILHDLSALAVMVGDFLAESRAGPLPCDAARPEPRRVQGWLGVKTLSTEEGKAGMLAGLVVLSVAKASPAQTAGLRPTDILHSIDGTELFLSSDIAAAMAGRAAGSLVPIRFRRFGQWYESEVEIRAKRRRIMER